MGDTMGAGRDLLLATQDEQLKLAATAAGVDVL